MKCDNCQVAKNFPAYRFFNPACLYCGARFIQHLGTYRIAPQECVQRRRVVLADWMAHGHPEAQLRALAKGPLPIAPEQAPEVLADKPAPKKRK